MSLRILVVIVLVILIRLGDGSLEPGSLLFGFTAGLTIFGPNLFTMGRGIGCDVDGKARVYALAEVIDGCLRMQDYERAKKVIAAVRKP